MNLVKWINGENKSAKNEYNMNLADLFDACCNSHYSMLKKDSSLISNFVAKDYIEILKNCLLLNKDKRIQNSASVLLSMVISEILKDKNEQKELMNKLLIDFLNTAVSECPNSEPYFNLINGLIVILFNIL